METKAGVGEWGMRAGAGVGAAKIVIGPIGRMRPIISLIGPISLISPISPREPSATPIVPPLFR